VENAEVDHSFGPLLNWLNKRLEAEHLAPTVKARRELAFSAERLVRHYFGSRQPLRRAAVAKKLATLSRNLNRAAKSASELGEDGIAEMLLASDRDGAPESADPLKIIADLQDWARWSSKAAETAKLMSWSAQDHKGRPNAGFAAPQSRDNSNGQIRIPTRNQSYAHER
jgi:hypothetical protein